MKRGQSILSSALTGAAGEYFVAAQLSRLGYVASINLKNTKGVDILVMNEDGTRSAMIQVKTHQGSGRKWILSNKAESTPSERMFYVFVDLNGIEGTPEYFIVPARDVAAHVRATHSSWLAKPGRKGPRSDNAVRVFRDPGGAYKDRWNLLGLDSDPIPADHASAALSDDRSRNER